MTDRSLHRGFFLLLVAVTTVTFFGLIRGFLMALFWAVVLAIVFQPVQRWWLARTRGRAGPASVLTVLTVVVVVLLPIFALGVALSREAFHFYDRIDAGEIDLEGPLARARALVPMATGLLELVGFDLDRIREGMATVAAAASQWIGQQAVGIAQDAVRITVLGALTLYVLFFFLRDGERIVDGVLRVLPLKEERERALFERFASVSRATIGGALAVSAVQGGLGGLLFWILGIPGPVFWGVIMTVLSFLPAVGTILVWGPAAIVLALTGSPVRAAILVAVGLVIIGLADNVLRPILVGRYARMPDFLILISTLGGLAVFGLSGVVVGPVIAAFFLTVWAMFGEEYGRGGSADEAGSV